MRSTPAAMMVAAVTAITLIAIHAEAQAPSRDASKDEDISSIRAEPGQGRSSVWTAARIREAQPVPPPIADPAAVRAEFKARRPSPPTSGTEPSGPTNLGRQSGNVRFFPLTMAGQLFFNEPSDKPGWGHACTAQFVASNVILTASHCVQDETPPYAYYKNFAFRLEYEQGKTKRQYGFNCVANLKGWAQPGAGHYLYDYAMIQTDAPSDVGWFGMQWSWWVGQFDRATKIGYPSGSDKGEVIQIDAGPLSVTDGIVELKHGNMHVQHGASGGAWIGDYSTNPVSNLNHIISSQSFSRDETSGISYGPYYTDSVLTLLNYVKAGCRNQ
jgi:hypothetical protein